MADLEQVQSTLGIKFKDPALLELALIHSSFINERPGSGLVSNERLEFLGDAVLGLYIAEKLYLDFPNADEGELTRFRSLLVRRETLTRLAVSLDLGAFLYLGRGEEQSGGRAKPANLSRALEAVIAAVYLDQGCDRAARFIHRLFAGELERIETLASVADSKSRLQEIVQARFQATPAYTVVDVSDGDEPAFNAEVRVKSSYLGSGRGRSKKEAEAHAARQAIAALENSLHPGGPLLNLDSK
jgi:ribonuclease-3